MLSILRSGLYLKIPFRADLLIQIHNDMQARRYVSLRPEQSLVNNDGNDDDDDDDADDGNNARAEHIMINSAVDACIGSSSGVTGLKVPYGARLSVGDNDDSTDDSID
jgi:hypothetical protein